ncbi:hypothetical protein EVAR_95715_1 [Eumeta japonica]|uniref:Uncharacterized protein n=1 Tax=Eumeta variegata TaxID=151549 RepID=A0A4C1UKT0_EUMVA|nr:hypothetical protein EVAR_95715_1 [Eumeta japonica]
MIINHFGNQRKRKFPGPAGLLTGSLNESKDEDACQIEVLSQDIDYSAINENIQIFESSLWKNLIDYVRESNLEIKVDSVKSIKQQALSGNLKKKKAQIITALVEAIDRSATDPLIILRDSSDTRNSRGNTNVLLASKGRNKISDGGIWADEWTRGGVDQGVR